MQVSYFLFSSMNVLSQNSVRMRIAWRVKSFLKSLFSVPSLELESICISYKSTTKITKPGSSHGELSTVQAEILQPSPKPCECLSFPVTSESTTKSEHLMKQQCMRTVFNISNCLTNSFKIIMTTVMGWFTVFLLA